MVLALTGIERLFETFLSEVKPIEQQQQDQKSLVLARRATCTRASSINTEQLLKHTNSDPEVLRSVAHVVENVAITLYRVYERTAQDRTSLLSTLPIWSRCTLKETQNRKIVDSIRANRTKHKDKDVDRKKKKMNCRIRRIEVQVLRACTALLALGPALDPQTIIAAADKARSDHPLNVIFIASAMRDIYFRCPLPSSDDRPGLSSGRLEPYYLEPAHHTSQMSEHECKGSSALVHASTVVSTRKRSTVLWCPSGWSMHMQQMTAVSVAKSPIRHRYRVSYPIIS